MFALDQDAFNEFDINEVCEILEEKGVDWMDPKTNKPIDRLLINNCEQGDCYADYIGSDDYDCDQADAVAEGTLESVNRALKAANSGLEIKRVFLADGRAFILVPARETAKTFVERNY